MIDDPYGLDFFENITDCSFGGNWMILIVDLRISGLFIMNVTTILPGQTIKFVEAGTVVPAFAVAPYTISSDSLKAKLPGGPYTGFGIRNFPGAPLRGSTNGQLWIKMDALPKTKFTVRFNYDVNSVGGSGDIELMYVALMKGDPKVGGILAGPDPVTIVTSTQTTPPVALQTAATDTSDQSRSFTFLVDPVNMTVGPPSG